MEAAGSAMGRIGRAGRLLAVACCGLFAAGLAGWLTAALGYALFAAAVLSLGIGVAAFAAFALVRHRDARAPRPWFAPLLGSGLCAYLLSVSALAGYYVRETLQGRMEWHWILFGPCILVALVVLDVGLYRKLVRNNLPTWHRYRQYISREASDPLALRRTFVDEVLLHRSLYRTSRIRWLRHTLIYWGFAAMLLMELIAVTLRDGFPAFGWRDIWREEAHPVPLAFAFGFDATGLMIVAGCVLALGWRLAVNGTSERKYSDTPTTVFLLLVVLTGFLVEALRILPTVAGPVHRFAFVGWTLARVLVASGIDFAGAYRPVWVVHVVASCAFIAYVPVMRLVHSCATPLGRLANSQAGMLAAKKRGVLAALMPGRVRGAVSPERVGQVTPG